MAAGEAVARAVRRAMVKVVEIMFAGMNRSENLKSVRLRMLNMECGLILIEGPW